MVRPTSCDSNGMRKGAWGADEDAMLRAHIQSFGHRNWRLVPILAGLKRCGKSCRLRWVNYLKPGVRRGNFTQAEEDFIIQLHAQIGNKWSTIAATLNGRTDNEIKNHWHAHLKKRGSSRRDVSADAATKPSSSIARASNEYQPKKLENPESVFNWQPQAGHLSWADAANYQTSITNVLEALPFVSRELDDMELVCQELDRLNSESNCSNYSSSNHNRSSAESLSPGCLRSNPFGDDAGSYDVMTGLW